MYIIITFNPYSGKRYIMNKKNFVHPRDQIVDIMKRIYGYGMTTTSGGNLSILDSDGNMWISPGGIDKGTLRSLSAWPGGFRTPTSMPPPK